MTTPSSHPEPRPRRRWGRRILIGLLSMVVLTVIAGTALWFLKPWAPQVSVTDPGAGGRRITENGLMGNYYPAASTAPGLLIFGGSEGGLAPLLDEAARALNAEGYSVLALSYFGGEGQSEALEEIPLETFTNALDS
ncbi:MAG: hypothetical protein ACK5LN_02285 [Propioniciclava sp.]